MKSPFPKEVYKRNAGIYKILANPVRLEILNTIKHKAVTVNNLAAAVGARKAKISQHLFILKRYKLVVTRKEGKNVYYRITNPKLVEPCRILKKLYE